MSILPPTHERDHGQHPQLPSPPALGHPVPSTHHAISVQIPTWKDMCDIAHGETRIKAVQQVGYPRSFIHPDIKEVATACVQQFGSPSKSYLLFHTASSANACREYLVSSHPDSEIAAVEPQAITIREFECDIEVTGDGEIGSSDEQVHPSKLFIHAIFFPQEALPLAMWFWRLTGLGLSSRRAAVISQHLSSLREVPPRPASPSSLRNV